MKNNIVDAIIEIPLNTKNKFEIDETTGKIRLDRVLYSAMNYPVEYGYIENTLALDGDPLDILLVSSAPTFPGCIVEARVIGYLEVIDNGHEDYKIISVVNVDPRYNEINTLNDMPKFILEEIKDFFSNYKTLQNIPVEVLNYHDTEEALEIIENCKQRYKNKENLNKVQIEKIKFFLNNNQNRNCKAICNITLNNNKNIENIKIKAKFNGATGNYSAILTAFPQLDWQTLNKKFVEEYLGLTYNPLTTQIESHDYTCHILCGYTFQWNTSNKFL